MFTNFNLNDVLLFFLNRGITRDPCSRESIPFPCVFSVLVVALPCVCGGTSHTGPCVSGLQEGNGGLWDSITKAAFIMGSGILLLAAFGNSLTWYALDIHP